MVEEKVRADAVTVNEPPKFSSTVVCVGHQATEYDHAGENVVTVSLSPILYYADLLPLSLVIVPTLQASWSVKVYV